MPTKKIQKNEWQSRRLEVKLSVVAGFTLIEVMIVIAIIGIMTAIVLSSFGSGRIERELETNAREFASVVREAQNYALTGRQFAPSGSDPCAFRVVWTSSNYTLVYRYKTTAVTPCDSGDSSTFTDANVLTYDLRHGVTSDSNDSVEFSVPHATLNVSGNKSVLFTKSPKDHRVCIYADGRITDYAGGAPCP